jgi:uncharacterized RmlC-like cupin family protein
MKNHARAEEAAPMPALLMTPDPAQLKRSNYGLWMHELVNGSNEGNAPGAPASVAFLVLGPGEKLGTHRHDRSWAYIVLFDAGEKGAVIQYGPGMRDHVVQQPGQVVVIPPGLPHRGYNMSDTDTVIGYEFRTCSSVFGDRVLLPHLDEVPLEQPPPRRRRKRVSGASVPGLF